MNIFGLPFSELLALITICTIIGGGLGTIAMLWLSSRFVKKSAYYHDKEEAEEALTEYKKEAQADLNEFKGKFEKLREDHILLTAGPLKEHTEALRAMKSSLEKMDTHGQERHEAFITAMQALSNRVLIVETKQAHRTARSEKSHD